MNKPEIGQVILQQFKIIWAGLKTAVSISVVLSVPAWVQAGQGGLNPPSGPSEAGSQMVTLEDIYNRLDTGAAGQKQTSFTEPSAGPGDGQGRTMDEIMGKAPAMDDSNGARPEDVAAGKTFWGLRSDGWGVQTGTHTVDSGSGTSCGAYVAPNVWKEFDCYNLAAIGKITGADPFTPSWELIGGYWQWGRKGPDPVDWYNTNTASFAHGPTGLDSGDANSGGITGWDQTDAPDGAWSDSMKTGNDPCPAGYRVPTQDDWDDVLANNEKVPVGSSWSASPTNYGTGLKLGDSLFLPAAGWRYYSSGALDRRGGYGYYWSSLAGISGFARALSYAASGSGAAVGSAYRHYGFSVRCISE